MSLVRTKTLVGILVAAHTLVPGLLAIGLVDLNRGGPVASAAWGICFGQVSVSALWLAWGPQNLPRRVLVSFGIVLLTSGATAIPAYSPWSPIWLLHAVFVVVFWATLCASLLLIRVVLGNRLRRPKTNGARVADAQSRYGLRHLLTGMLAVAATLGVGRYLVTAADVRAIVEVVRPKDVYQPLSVFILSSVLVTLPAIFSGSAPRHAWLWIAVGLCSAVVITALELVVVQRLTDQPGDASDGWVMNGAHYLWVLGTVCTLRLNGFRMVRE